MKIERILFWFGLFCLIFSSIISARLVLAYDATFNFSQQYPELVAGWKIKAGPTKGGPYPHVIDCKKPVPLADGTYDCVGIGLTANPIYAVAVNYNSAGTESPQSPEATMTITVPPPANMKIVVKITTVSRLTKYGNVIASTTITRKEVPAGTVVKEGTTGYRNSLGEWITNTTIALN
jgi:hypothetical protein